MNLETDSIFSCASTSQDTLFVVAYRKNGAIVTYDKDSNAIKFIHDMMFEFGFSDRIKDEQGGRFALYNLKQLCDTLASVMNENTKLYKQIEEHRQSVQDNVHVQVKEVQAENIKLREHLEFRERQNDALLNQFMEVQKERTELEDENKKLKEEAAERFRFECFKSFNTGRPENQLRLVYLESEKAKIQEENNNLKFQLEHYEIMRSENYFFKEEITNLRAEKDDLKRKLDESITRNSALSDATNKFVTGYLKAMDRVQILEEVIASEECVTIVDLYNNQRENIKGLQYTVHELDEQNKHLESVNKELKSRLSVIMDHIEDILVENITWKKRCAQSDLKRGQLMRDKDAMDENWRIRFDNMKDSMQREIDKTWWQKLRGK